MNTVRCLPYAALNANTPTPAAAPGPSFGSSASFGGPYVLFFSMQGCGHCTRAVPEFEKAAEMAASRGIYMGVVRSETAYGRAQIARAGITGFPTILGYHNGQVARYSGPRSAESFLEFAASL